MKKISALALCTLLLKISMAQNVGIGTTSPSEKLHVAGNVKADTVKPNALTLPPNAGAGKVLTSDAAGNGTWQEIDKAGTATAGFGTWGDCTTNGNISEYNPVMDSTGTPNSGYGYSVAISGNFAIVGSPSDDANGITNSGSVSFFRHDGKSWVFMQKLSDAAATPDEWLGWSVSISGNYAIAGAYQDENFSSNQGTASMYFFNGTSWVFTQKIFDVSGEADDNFGFSVSISGTFAVIGAPLDNTTPSVDQGTATVYRFNGTNWVFFQKLVDPGYDYDDRFGHSVSISGNRMIISLYQDDVGTNSAQGSANIYSFNGTTWILMQKLTDPNPVGGEKFGQSVAISGDNAVAGIPSRTINGNSQQGAASVFRYYNGSWQFVQTLTDPAGAFGDYFGQCVAISNNNIIVGASYTDIGSASATGSAFIFTRVNGFWQKTQKVTDPAYEALAQFGFSVAIDETNKRFGIGGWLYMQGRGKVVFGKIN